MKKITITQDLLEDILEKIGTWCYQIDPMGDPNSTQFGYCVRCNRPDYRGHDHNCEVAHLLQKLKALKGK